MRPSFASQVVMCVLTGLLQSCSGPNEPAKSDTAPAAFVTIDSVTCYSGQTVDVSIRLTLSSEPTGLDSIQSFIINVTYNDSLIRCIDGRLGEADSAWGYFGWREFPSHPPYDVRAENLIKASRPDVYRPPRRISEAMPEGEIVRLTFEVSADSTHIGRTAEISFSTTTCEANTLVDAKDRYLFHMMRFNATNDPMIYELDTLNCIRRYTLIPDLEFASGAIEITAPPYVPPDPRITVSLESLSGVAGDTIESSISIAYGLTPPYLPPGFGGLQFYLTYDTTALTPDSVIPGEQLAGWEYFTWRKRSLAGPHSTPGLMIVSILEMNDGTTSTGAIRPRGELAAIRFRLHRDLSSSEFCDAVSFWSSDAGDNIIADMSGDLGFLPLPEQSGLLFGPYYDSTNCGGAVDACQLIVQYSKTHCQD